MLSQSALVVGRVLVLVLGLGLGLGLGLEARALTKYPGGRFLEDVVEGSGQVGVVPRPDGALCLQHSVAGGHLENK